MISEAEAVAVWKELILQAGETARRGSGPDVSFDSLTHAKSILVSPPDVAIDHLFPPYTMEKVQALSKWTEY